MTTAQSTHRSNSLVRRRSAERAGALLDRSAHRRPGAGFLPLRLPVARRPRAGYRVYSASDFFYGRDLECLHQSSAAPSPRKSRRGSRRLASLSLALAVFAVAATLIASAASHGPKRRGTRTRARSGPTPAQMRPAAQRASDLPAAPPARGRHTRPGTRILSPHRRTVARTAGQLERLGPAAERAQGRSTGAQRGAPPFAPPSERQLAPRPAVTPPPSARGRLEFGFEE
jgi:hypothetical protein